MKVELWITFNFIESNIVSKKLLAFYTVYNIKNNTIKKLFY